MCKILNRIKEIADNENITIAALERSIGASKGVIYKAISKGTDIQAKWIEAIVENYPQYSAQWLLTGKGAMLESSTATVNEPNLEYGVSESPIGGLPVVGLGNRRREVDPDDTPGLKPRIPFDAAAGALSIVTDSVALKDCEMFPTITAFPRYDFTMPIHGDSMEPEFLSGDEVACQLVREKAYIQWGRVHILDTRDGAVIKRIYDNGKLILCKSINPLYPDFPVPKEDILQIALVVGMLRRY